MVKSLAFPYMNVYRFTHNQVFLLSTSQRAQTDQASCLSSLQSIYRWRTSGNFASTQPVSCTEIYLLLNFAVGLPSSNENQQELTGNHVCKPVIMLNYCDNFSLYERECFWHHHSKNSPELNFSCISSSLELRQLASIIRKGNLLFTQDLTKLLFLKGKIVPLRNQI